MERAEYCGPLEGLKRSTALIQALGWHKFPVQDFRVLVQIRVRW